MGDLFGRKKAIDDAVEGAEKGKAPKTDPCAALVAKVARQPAGSARRKLAEQQLADCRASHRQSTDSNN